MHPSKSLRVYGLVKWGVGRIITLISCWFVVSSSTDIRKGAVKFTVPAQTCGLLQLSLWGFGSPQFVVSKSHLWTSLACYVGGLASSLLRRGATIPCRMLFFLDLGALSWGPGSSKYWEGWRTTHVFFCLGEDVGTVGPHKDFLLPRCPPGWFSWSALLGHWEAGRATSGRWSMVAWYPTLMPFSEPLPVIPQLWFPLFSYVKDRERATPYPSPLTRGALVAAVVRVDGLVQDWGLFPASDLKCSSSPSGYGLRCLTGAELGGLWDMPISVLDVLPPQGADTLLRAIYRMAPTEILFAGADFLQTLSFRGGLGGLRLGVPNLELGPCPLTNAELGLSLGQAHSLAPFSLVEVLKGDSQKANNAAVPDQLWLHAFMVGYGNPCCLAWHCLALGLGEEGLAGGMSKDGPPPGWQASMTGFCLFGICVWRRRVFQGYLRWRRSNVPWQSNLLAPAQMVRCRMGMAFGGVNAVYEWPAKGRLSYNKQWALLRGLEEGLATVEAGLDAI